MNNEQQIRARVDNWAKAVRDRNYDGIMEWHHRDFVMYDVPGPFQSVGIDAYRKTWDLFFQGADRGENSFRVVELTVFAGEDVAFAYAPMKCVYLDPKAQRNVELDFRLTVGFKKIDGQWWFMHEHHSVPAE
jgi:uncharacterized protein (TIGR02246 family)